MNKENFSEEKRKWITGNKKIIILSMSLIVACVVSGILGVLYIQIDNRYNTLENSFIELNQEYFILTGGYIELEDNYDALLDNYNALTIAYDYICSSIKQSILPVQYSIFAEAVRRYYIPIYMEGLTGKAYWMAFAEFCRDMILHDSGQYNAFSEVSNAFSNALRFGSDTMYLAWYIMATTFDWCDTIEYWGLDELTGLNNLTIMDTVVQECIDNIDYEYDSDITKGQSYFDEDYIKFPVETAFRTMGDCEDQAILTATYLESCGFETAISIFHDPEHPTLGDFYHCVPLVHIEDTDTFKSLYPSCGLWRFSSGDPYYPNYTWCFLDTTWDVPFGSTPSWLDDYGGYISFSFCSMGFCEIDGAIV